MPAQSRDYTRLTLTRSVYAFVLITLAAIFVLLAAILADRSGRMIDEALDRAVNVRTHAAAKILARSLERDWRSLGFLAEQATNLKQDTLRGVLDGMQGEGDRISWIGYTDINGRVIEATDGMLIGQDVSARPWFRGGLNGGFAGDMHEALLLAKLLGSETDEPLRFIDLSRPVLDVRGQVIGVVGMHINANWLEGSLRETARNLELDLFLLSADGSVVATTTGETPRTSDLEILRVAQTGSEGAMRETWPDGQDYFSTLVPQISFKELPSFGWRMLGRIETKSFASDAALLRQGGLLSVLAILAILFGATAIYVRIFAAPLAMLAGSAERIAGGSDEYPPSSTVTREAAQISSALARLQQDRPI
ncbi:cache domain-containing protein [Paracoccus sp. MBLB3053]|uniref:Cache domain-containing protein n=1 Tax=Paracoccus aurantius TaxID=3073814 RepID=A0ABU2HY83_9RHOB|nr:cache domain-containing protein [Paracoccus sp. MBLB3053]MDS9470017.1 cache domain-containing protein [Paracoccus sp. MBLB3053]